MTKSQTDSIGKVISLVFSVSRLIREKYVYDKSSSQLSYLNLETLRYVKEKKDPLMKNVADYLCITPPSATSLIDSLVKVDLLKRIFDDNDRRSIRLKITNQGKKMIGKNLVEITARMKKALSPLNKEEQEKLIKILKKLSKSHQEKTVE